MHLFNVRISKDLEELLQAKARSSNSSKSDIARQAIEQFLTVPTRDERMEATEDDWAEFGAAVVSAQIEILQSTLESIRSAEWNKVVEPVYDVFRRKIVEKSKAYRGPIVYRQSSGDVVISTAIGLAADDSIVLNSSLEQMFFDYFHEEGDKAFNDIPKIWERAKARIDAGEPASE